MTTTVNSDMIIYNQLAQTAYLERLQDNLNVLMKLPMVRLFIVMKSFKVTSIKMHSTKLVVALNIAM